MDGQAKQAGRLLFISDALRADPREGAQVLAGEVARHCVAAHGASAWGPVAQKGVSAFEPLLSGRLLGVAALRRLLTWRGAAVVYLPQNGLTTAGVLRAVLIMVLARPRSMDFLVLQHYTHPHRAWRLFARRWRFLVATAEQEDLVRLAGLSAAPLYPRVPASKVSAHRTRAEARAALGWSAGLQFLHVGHARRGRNLKALEPLAGAGTVRLVLSDYLPEEAGSLPPEGPEVIVHRGPCADLADRYRAADVYVFPTHDVREVIGLPMSVFESLANGTPVVARRGAALERWTREPGLHLADDDAALIATALRVAAEDGGTAALAQVSSATCLGDLTSCHARSD